MKRMSISNVNLLYLFMAMILIILGSLMQSMDAEAGLIATEFLLVLLPALLFAIWTRGGLKKIFRLNPLSFTDGIIVVSAIFFFYPVSITGNMIVLNLLDYLGWYRPIPFPSASNAQEYALLLFAVAVSAGICEEFLFRGIVMRAYERYGHKKAILCTAVLFGVFHFNIQNLLGPVMLGILFGYFVYLTDSIYAGILAHATHNALSVSISYLSSMYFEKNLDSESLEVASTGTSLLTTIFTITVVVLCLITIVKLIKHLKRRSIERLKTENNYGQNETIEKANPNEIQDVRWWAFLPLLAIGIIYILFEIVSRR